MTYSNGPACGGGGSSVSGCGVRWAATGSARSGRLRVEGGDADQVVDRRGELEPGPVALSADVAQLASSADGLDPPERFLDPFADPHARLVAGMSGGATVDRRSLAGRVLGH